MQVRNIILAVLTFAFMAEAAFARSIEVTARRGVKFRSAGGSVIGGIPRGTVVEVTKVAGNWTYVRYNGRVGRIYTKYTRTVDSGSTADDNSDDNNDDSTMTESPKPKPKPTTTAAATDDEPDNNGGGSTFDTSLRFGCSNGASSCKNKKWFNPKKADSGTCGDVVVNCQTHMISFSGIDVPDRERVINCGKKGKTKDGYGTIGGVTGGKRVPNAININMKGMGTPAGGKWFHVPWWNADMRPTGINSSRGCIHISPLVMALLKRCNGSKLTIKNSYGGSSNKSGRDTDEGEAEGRY